MRKAAKGKAAAASSPGQRPRPRPLDIPALLLPLAALAWLAFTVYSPKGEPSAVTIIADAARWIYPLSEDRKVAAPGPLGNTTIAISGKTVRVEDSPCANKLCVHQGAISVAGQWIACLPNHVLVRIEGGAQEGPVIDAETR